MPPRHLHLRPRTPSSESARRDAGTPGWAPRREPWRVRGAPLRSRRHPQALPPLRGRGHQRRPPTRAVSAAAPAPGRERLHVLVEPSSRFFPRSLHEPHGSDTQGRSGSGAMLGCGSGMARGVDGKYLLLEAGLALAAKLSPPAVLQRNVDPAVEVTGARYGALGVIGARRAIAQFVTTGITAEQRRDGGTPGGPTPAR